MFPLPWLIKVGGLHEETQVEEERRAVEGHRLGIFVKDVHPLPAFEKAGSHDESRKRPFLRGV